MSVIYVKCPHCGRSTQMDSEKGTVVCAFCRNTVYSGMSSASPDLSPKKMEIIRMGNLNWVVLKKWKEGYSFLLSQDIVACQPFHEEFSNTTWEKCSLREWLNGDFYNKTFSESEKSRIILSKVYSDEREKYAFKRYEYTNDKLFLLSLYEAQKIFANDFNRVCKYHGNNCIWWLRTPIRYEDFAAYVDYNGKVQTDGFVVNGQNGGVRPAMIVEG